VFRGLTAISVDDKGRFSMPARYRETLLEEVEGQLVVTIDTQAPCLLLYPLADWEIIERKIEALPSFNPASRRVQRLLIGHATEVALDAQGRLLIPTLLRDYAKIDKTLILVGQGKKFEIWSEETWNSERARWLEPGIQDEQLAFNLQELSL